MNKNISRKAYILIPAFNEAQQIGSVVSELKEAGYENILVVNDGSKDETGKIAENSGAEVINHIINRGQGAALRTGINYLKEAYAPDAIITFDADGQHDLKYIPALLRPIFEDGIDITLGSRFLDAKSEIPFLRKVLLKSGVIFTNAISGIKLTDTHNGLRALGKNAINSIQINHRKMEHASDIIDEIAVKKLKCREIPVEIKYTEYSIAKGQKSSGFLKMAIKIIIKKIAN